MFSSLLREKPSFRLNVPISLLLNQLLSLDRRLVGITHRPLSQKKWLLTVFRVVLQQLVRFERAALRIPRRERITTLNEFNRHLVVYPLQSLGLEPKA